MHSQKLSKNDSHRQIHISSVIEDFINYCQYDKGLSQNTQKSYRQDLKQFSEYIDKDTSMLSWLHVGKHEIRDFLRSFKEAKPRTINRKLATLKAFFGYLEDEEILLDNPTKRINFRIKVPHELPRHLGQTQVEKLLRSLYEQLEKETHSNDQRHTKRLRNLVLVETLFNTGMRVSEVSYLQIRNLNLEEGYFHVRGKGNKDRIIPICGTDYLKKLKRYLRSQYGNSWRSEYEGYIFLNRDNNRLSEQSIRGVVKACTKQIGLQSVTPHVFRHSIATQLLDEGTDIRVIQKFLGHSSIATTSIYASVSQHTQRNIILANHPRSKLTIKG